MTNKLAPGLTALAAALLVGADVFGLIGVLDWAVAHQLGLSAEAKQLAFAAAGVPALIAALWVGREAWRAERRLANGADVG
eukprot:g980.t1